MLAHHCQPGHPFHLSPTKYSKGGLSQILRNPILRHKSWPFASLFLFVGGSGDASICLSFHSQRNSKRAPKSNYFSALCFGSRAQTICAINSSAIVREIPGLLAFHFCHEVASSIAGSLNTKHATDRLGYACSDGSSWLGKNSYYGRWHGLSTLLYSQSVMPSRI